MSEVTDVLRDRMAEPSGLDRMITASLLAHGLFIAVIVIGPGRLWNVRGAAPETVMTISLGGGATGPDAGGMTSIGARPIQQQTPPEEAPKREAIRPPAAKTPEMTLPNPKARPTKATSAPPVKEAPDDAKGRTPTRGAETRPGTAFGETGARGQGFGLSTSGGSGSGSYLDVANFCCPDYIQIMADTIKRNWNPQSGVTGEVLVQFTIQRDGSLTGIAVEKSSGITVLDMGAQRALFYTRKLPPLPAQYPNPTLGVHLNFIYER